MESLFFLQFLGAIIIILHHLGYPVNVGHLGTTFFFIVSGYLNSYNIKKRGTFTNVIEYISIIFKKIQRNYCTYVITIILDAFIWGGQGKYNWGDLICHFFMLQTVYPIGDKVFLFNVPLWFMATLSVIYFFLPFMDKYFQKKQPTLSNASRKYHIKLMLALSVCLMFICVVTVIIEPKSAPYSVWWWLFYISPYSRIWEFMAGYILYLIFEECKEGIYLRTNNCVQTILFTIIEIILLLTVLFVRIKGEIYLTVSILFLVFVFSLKKGYISHLFAINGLQNLGKLSTNMFFWHQVIIDFVTIKIASPHYRVDISLEDNVVRLLIVVIFTSCVAYSWGKAYMYCKKSIMTFYNGSVFKTKI